MIIRVFFPTLAVAAACAAGVTSPASSRAQATASSSCLVECGSTSWDPKKKLTHLSRSVTITSRLNSSHPFGSSRWLSQVEATSDQCR